MTYFTDLIAALYRRARMAATSYAVKRRGASAPPTTSAHIYIEQLGRSDK